MSDKDDEDEFEEKKVDEGGPELESDDGEENATAGSADPFADDDEEYDFPDPDSDDDDFDFPMPGDDDDDDFDFPELDDYVPAAARGGGKLAALKENLSGGMIALIASGSVFLLIVIGLVTWLSLSFDEEAFEQSNEKVEVVTSLAGLEPAAKPKAKAKEKPAPKPKPVTAPAPKPEEPGEAKTLADELAKAAAEEKAAPDSKAVAKKDAAKPESKPADDKAGAEKADGKAASDKPADDKGPGDKDSKDGKSPEGGPVQLAKIDPAMIDETPTGPLPVIAPDGREAWQVYARPFNQPEEDKKAGRVALVIAGLGLSKTQTLAAIQQMPGEVTLSFAPYARNLGDWIAQARAAGHEVILELPMEPEDYPNSDPGPHTLLTSKGPTDNIDSLNWLLSRFPGYVGVTNFLGEKFSANEEAMRPILIYLKKRGLMYLDSRSSRKSVGAQLAKELKMPRAYNTRFIDREASRVSIDARLFELERIAKSTGAAVGIGFPFPVTLERLKTWMAEAKKKGIVLVPLSAVANMQTIR